MYDACHHAVHAMRTTLAIDDDILAAARHLAQRDNKSLGEVVSELARQGLTRAPARAAKADRNGIPLLRRGTAAVTPELVNQLRDELV
jgi:hypothetical protein